jgi:hypothetical protein
MANAPEQDPFDILNQVGCSYEKIKASLRIVSDGMHELVEDDRWQMSKGLTDHLYQQWLLLELIRDHLELTDDRFHTAESALYSADIPAQFKAPKPKKAVQHG